MTETASTTPTERSRLKADRRRKLLEVAAGLFAERGFGSISIEELGAAAGVTGPAVYRHFATKQDILATLLVGVSRRLLEGGSAVVAAAGSDTDALRGLVAFHLDFALTDPDLIRVHDRDLASLTPDDNRLVRRLQRAYLEVWVAVLRRREPALTLDAARTTVRATFGLLNSTAHGRGRRDRAETGRILGPMALACVRGGGE